MLGANLSGQRATRLVLTTGGKLEVRWKKGVFDGVKLEFDLGAGGMKSDIDVRPRYTMNWLPAAPHFPPIRSPFFFTPPRIRGKTALPICVGCSFGFAFTLGRSVFA